MGQFQTFKKLWLTVCLYACIAKFIVRKEYVLALDTFKLALHPPLDETLQASYEEIIENLNKIEDPDRYSNWYKGFTRIEYPTIIGMGKLISKVTTSATSGNISTKYFGDKFDIDKIDGKIEIQISVSVPRPYRSIDNITLREAST